MKLHGFIGGAYTLQSVNADCQRCVNLYPERNEVGTEKEQWVGSLVAAPGSRLLATVGNGPIRGAYRATNGSLYVASGDSLYSVSAAWSATLLGSLGTSEGRVSMADNGISLMLVDGSNRAAIVVLATGALSLASLDFCASCIAFQDGYFLLNSIGTGAYYITAGYDTTIDGLDFAVAEGSPDILVSLLVANRQVWLFGESTTEVAFDSGNPDFPFERNQNAFIEVGCAARYSPAVLGNTVIWLGGDSRGSGTVWRANGFQPQRISTHAVEYTLSTYSTIADAISWTYEDQGHSFYVLSFPTADKTWVFDTSTNLWHERMYFSNGEEKRHRGACHAYFNRTHVIGDWENGNLYALEPGTYTDNGSPKRWVRSSPHVSNDLKKLFYNLVQLDLEVGAGLDGIGVGTTPVVEMRYSDDGGHTWTSYKTRSAGAIGHYKSRALWRSLGGSRDRVFEFSGSDPIKTTLLGAQIDITKGIY